MSERGFYMHPEAYGKQLDASVHWPRHAELIKRNPKIAQQTVRMFAEAETRRVEAQNARRQSEAAREGVHGGRFTGRRDVVTGGGFQPYRDSAEHLTDELRRLDLRIARRLARMASGTRPSHPTRWPGRCTSPGPRSSGCSPTGFGGAPPEPADPALELLSAEITVACGPAKGPGYTLGLPALGRRFGLSPMELDAAVICVAPELRRGIRPAVRVPAGRHHPQRPSVDLVLDLLCGDERERWSARAVLAPHAPLLRSGLLRPSTIRKVRPGRRGWRGFLRWTLRCCSFCSARPGCMSG